MSELDYNIGDKVSVVVCRSNNSLDVISPTPDNLKLAKSNPDYSVHTLLVVGIRQTDKSLCLMVEPDFDPHKYHVARISDWHIQVYDVHEKYIGELSILVPHEFVFVNNRSYKKVEQIHMNEPGGRKCDFCFRWIDWADANLPHNVFACHNCRTTKGWKVANYLRNCGEDPKDFKV